MENLVAFFIFVNAGIGCTNNNANSVFAVFFYNSVNIVLYCIAAKQQQCICPCIKFCLFNFWQYSTDFAKIKFFTFYNIFIRRKKIFARQKRVFKNFFYVCAKVTNCAV